MRNYLHSGRQDMLVQALYRVVNAFHGGGGARAFAHEDDAFHYVVSMNRLPDLAEADLRSLRDYANILHSHRSAILGFEHCISDVVHIADQANGPDIDLLRALFDETSPGI